MTTAESQRTPLRVTHVLSRIRLEDGGVVRAVLDLCSAQAKHGLRVTAMAADAGDAPENWDGGDGRPELIEEPGLAMGAKAMLPWSRLPARAIEVIERSDVVHLHTPWDTANLAMARACRERGVAYVVSPHGMLDDWSMSQSAAKKRVYLGVFGKGLLGGASAIHFTAEAERQQGEKWTGSGRSHVAALLMDLSLFEELPGETEARAAFTDVFEPGEPVALFLSRLHPKKGAEKLIDACAMLAERGTRVCVALAGPGEDAYVASLKQLAADRGVGDRCHFLGMVGGTAKVSLYQAADVFVLPTSQENFGFVFFEALASGTPVVTTRGTDTWPELKESGGAIITDGSVEEIAEAVSALIDDDAARTRMGEQGRAWVLRTSSEGAAIERYASMYDHARNEEV